MRNNTKKGFTLVELLVVIAILAILATVSVVGYTSFIERANVSNDENIATQLNNFLLAYQADHTSDHYGEPITEDNIREITQIILRESGLNELNPQAASYGYHFYFHFDGQGGGEYVVMSDAAILQSPGMNAFALDVNSKYLGSCFTLDSNYYFVDTAGNDLAEVIEGIYTVDNFADFEELLLKASKLTTKDGHMLTKLVNYLNACVVVTNNGNFKVATLPEVVVFADGVEIIGTKYYDGTTVGDDYVLAKLDGELRIPNSVMFIDKDALNIDGNATIVIDKTVNELAKKATTSFTDCPIRLADGKTYYALETVIADDKTAPTVEVPYNFSNDMVNITGTLSAEGKKVWNNTFTQDEVEYNGYIVLDAGTFTLTPNGTGENPNIAATNTGVKWTVQGDAASYVSVNGNTFTINLSSITDVANVPATITILGEATESDAPNVTLVYKTVYLKSAYVEIDGQPNTGAINFPYGGETATVLKVEAFATPNIDLTNLSEYLELDYTFSIDNSSFTWTNNELKLADNATVADTETVTYSVSNYTYLTGDTITLTMQNEAVEEYVLVQNYSNLKFVGDANAIKASDLFKFAEGETTIPANAEIWVLAEVYETLDKNRAIQSVSLSTLDSTSLTLTGGSAGYDTATNQSPRVVVVVVTDGNGYKKISEYHALNVVSGAYNIRSWDELKARISADNGGDTKSNTKKMQLKSNVILISDIVMGTSWNTSKPEGFLDIISPSGASTTFHGNNFVFDIRSGRTTDEFVIRLQTRGVLDSVKIVGAVYNTVVYAPSSSTAYGASAVQVLGSTTVRNCYIANTRTPLRVRGNTTIIDSIFFGGRYANIELANASTITLQGNITTINQPDENNVVGFGIVVDMNATPTEEAIVKANDCNLVQYNFLSETLAANNQLPTISVAVSGKSGSVNLNTVFSNIIAEAEDGDDNDVQYAALTYKDGDIRYANAGIAYTNTWTITDNGSVTQKVGGGELANAPQNYGQVAITETKKSGTLQVDVTLSLYSPLKATYNEWFINRNTAMEQYSPENYCGVK